jgi:hypothetical protein
MTEDTTEEKLKRWDTPQEKLKRMAWYFKREDDAMHFIETWNKK